MTINTTEKWTIFKAKPAGVIFWWLFIFCFFAALEVIFHILEVPIFMHVIFLLGLLYMAGFGVVLIRARLRYNDSHIESRYFRNIKRKWSDVEGWSQLGENGTLFIRFSGGAHIWSNDWVLTSKNVKILIPLLRSKVGEPRTGDNIVLPWFVNLIFGHFIKSIMKKG